MLRCDFLVDSVLEGYTFPHPPNVTWKEFDDEDFISSSTNSVKMLEHLRVDLKQVHISRINGSVGLCIIERHMNTYHAFR